MGDLRDPRLMYLKGALFLLCGALGAALLLLEAPTLKVAALLALTVWCFSRAYYFAFYVVQHWIDPGYRFAGLFDFVGYLIRRKR
jgi:hypothetical protein